jgi:hypothetical protein
MEEHTNPRSSWRKLEEAGDIPVRGDEKIQSVRRDK